MHYQLINPNGEEVKKIPHLILSNRGIKDVKAYLKLTDEVLHSYESFGEVIHQAVERLLYHIEQGSLIQIVVDSDADGYCSASAIYMYIKNTLGHDKVIYSLHTNKTHGLTEDIVIQPEVKLVLLPDAGSNDVEQAKALALSGVDVIVLDHHISDVDNPYAIIVNNQMSEYLNKQLCGTGVVYKFLQALDDATWNSDSDSYLDLVALANIADIMDMRDFETRRLTTKGLQRIEHPFLKALLNKRKFDVSDTELPNVTDIAFYISPLINGTIRCGTAEEKELLFRAFIQDYAEFDYKPRRKSKDDPIPEAVKESIYERAARLALNARGRQNKLKEKSVNVITERFGEKNKDNIIFFANATNVVDQSLTGLVAMQIAKNFNRPCLALRKVDEVLYGGSGRNVNDGVIKNLKEELQESGFFDMVAGHDNSFGVAIKKENIQKAIEYFNEKYSWYDFRPVYYVDMVLDELTYKTIKEIEKIRWAYSSFIEEPKIAIEGFEVGVDDIQVFGTAPKLHWKITYNDIEYIKFNVGMSDQIVNLKACDSLVLDLVGTAKINRYANKVTPQFVVSDYEIIEKI